MSSNELKNSIDMRIDRCAYVRELSDDRLSWLVFNPPFGTDLLKHAARCEECGARIEAVGKREFQSLTPEEQKRSIEWAAKFVAQNFEADLSGSTARNEIQRLRTASSPFLDLCKLMDQRTAPSPWKVDHLGVLTRSVNLPAGGFRQLGALEPVLGSATVEYEFDLFGVLEALGLAKLFSDFKLLLRTGHQTSAAAMLLFRHAQQPSERPLLLEVDLMNSSGRLITPRGITLRVGEQKRSSFVRLNAGLRDPVDFSGQVRITIRELPQMYGDADNS